MIWIKNTLNFAVIPICLGLAIVSSQTVQVVAQSQQSWKISQSFQPPNRGTPPTTSGGATRGSCGKSNKPLTSLMPKEKLGLTFAERPSFFWYVPQSGAKTANFLLLDRNDDVVYETNFLLPNKAGIIGFTLPANAPSLEVNQRYHWYLEVSCSPEETDDKINVEGWLERTEPSLAVSKALETAQPQKRSEVYAEAGIWHETLATLIEQRCASPNDAEIITNWNKLLESVGLKNVASEPLNNNCRLNK